MLWGNPEARHNLPSWVQCRFGSIDEGEPEFNYSELEKMGLDISMDGEFIERDGSSMGAVTPTGDDDMSPGLDVEAGEQQATGEQPTREPAAPSARASGAGRGKQGKAGKGKGKATDKKHKAEVAAEELQEEGRGVGPPGHGRRRRGRRGRPHRGRKNEEGL